MKTPELEIEDPLETVKTNEQILIEFITEKGFNALHTDWVLWMLAQLKIANQKKLLLNPILLRKSFFFPLCETD